MKKILFFLTFLFVVSEINANYEYEELLIPAGARATGCAKNFVSMYDTAEGLFYNPSLAAMSPYGELVLEHNIFYLGSSLQNLSCSFPLGKIGFGIVGRRFTTPEIQVVKDYELIDEKFRQTMLEGSGVFAVKLTKNISVGVAAKYVEKSIYKQKSFVWLYDTGLLIKTSNDLFSIGASLLNYSFSNDKVYPTNYNLGIKFKFDLPQQQTKINFLLSTQIDYYTNKPVYSFGLEHWGSEILGVRLGYVYDKDKIESKVFEQISYFSAGVSLRIGGFEIDYAYLPNSILGATHNIGVSLRFSTISKKKKETVLLPCELIVEPLVFSPNNDGRLDNIFFRYNVSTYTQIVEVSYSVKDINGNTMFVYESTTVAKEIDKFFVYDGKTTDGKTLTDGIYTAEVVIKDQKEDKIVLYKSQKEFVVDTQPPDIEIKTSTETFSPDNDGINDVIEFFINVKDELSFIQQLDIGIFTTQDKKVYTYKIDLSTSQKSFDLKLSWDGKDEIYNKVVPNGKYKLVVNTKDKAENKNSKEISFEVYVEEKPKVVVEKEEKLFYIKGAKVLFDDRGIVVIYSTDELFDKEGQIKPDKYDSLSSLGEIIKEKYKDKKILIEGHTDSVGDELENKRKSSIFAWTVYSFFIKNLSLDPKQFEVKGYGEERPIASNKTKVGRAQNRRVEIIITK